MEPGEVKRIISSLPYKKKVEKVSIEQAYQRVLCEDVFATINLPPFKRAAMDGYAVLAKDTFIASEDKPTSLKLQEVVMAGEVPQIKVEEGTCTEVSTGAPIPEGADAVVMIEYTEKNDENILILESVAMGANIADAGSDVKVGDLLLSQGELITSDKIGVLSAIGLSEIPVLTQPRVAVISTGNEIIKLHEKLEYGKIYDINSYTIFNAVKSCGCQPIYSDIVKDDYQSLKSKMAELKDADIIITSGGTSAGAGDVLSTVLAEIGDVLVHGIAMKPGKPTIVGLIKDGAEEKVIFGLPGYPVAALIVFHVFVAPFLRKIASYKVGQQERKSLKLELARRYHSARGRKQVVLVKIIDNIAYPILKDSGAISALADADGYFEVPKNVEIVNEGTIIEVFSIRDWMF